MRTESVEEFTSSFSARPVAVSASESAEAAAKWTAKLAGYAVATVAFTFMLLRPRRAAAGKRGSLFLGSGVLVVLVRTLLSSEGASPTPVPASPVQLAASPVPSRPSPAPSNPGVSHKRPASAAVVPGPKPTPAGETYPKKQRNASAVATAAVTPVFDAKPRTAAPAKTVATGTNAPPAQAKPKSALGPRYADKAGGYSVQFPTGWTSRPFKDGCWVLDASDGQAAITVGFSRFPAAMSVDEVVPEKVTRGLQKRPGTVVHSTGYATIAGRRCLWHKYTGPVSRPAGNARMTAVHYLLPLQDGRALEIRVAAAPEKFNTAATQMKRSLDSFKLLTPLARATAPRVQ